MKARKVPKSVISLVMSLERGLLLNHGLGKLAPECGCLFFVSFLILGPTEERLRSENQVCAFAGYLLSLCYLMRLKNAFVNQGDLFNMPVIPSTYCELSKHSL